MDTAVPSAEGWVPRFAWSPLPQPTSTKEPDQEEGTASRRGGPGTALPGHQAEAIERFLPSDTLNGGRIWIHKATREILEQDPPPAYIDLHRDPSTRHLFWHNERTGVSMWHFDLRRDRFGKLSFSRLITNDDAKKEPDGEPDTTQEPDQEEGTASRRVEPRQDRFTHMAYRASLYDWDRVPTFPTQWD